jgi:hypothetical protein
MIKRMLVRLGYGLLFAIPLMILTFAMAKAETPQQDVPPNSVDCSLCHASFTTAWEESSHAHAGVNPLFLEALEAVENPAQCMGCHVTGYDAASHTWTSDAITCQACHDTENTNHPMEPMAAERSAKLCGACHQETMFEWQISAHRESGLDCVGCHDPHATDLKKENEAMQCAACHRTRASNFAHSEHSQSGLTCTSCHLAELRSHAGEGHARLDHSFNVRLSTCNSCHAYQMHDPVEVHPERSLPNPVDAMAAVETLPVTPDPMPVSPVGFATLSGFFGLALGAILAPWIERRIKKSNRQDQ